MDKSQQIKTVIVVPCYNEEKRLIKNVFLDYLKINPDIGFLFVNDGSSDDTLRVLSSLKKESGGQAEILSLERNSGKAEAVRRGILHCDNVYSGYSYIGYWDADLATPLEELERFVEYFKADPSKALIMGARVKLLGREIHRRRARHYIGRVFATFASITLKLAVYDTQTGAKLFRNGPHIANIFGQPFDTNWIFDIEILARLIKWTDINPTEQIAELPLRTWIDVSGSKIKMIDGIRAFYNLIKIARKYRI